MPNLKPNIQEIFPINEKKAKKFTSKIKNQPMTILFKKDNIVHFLTPSVEKSNHQLRVIFGNEKKLNKYFINPKRKLLKKTFSKKGANVEFKDLQDHSVLLINYKEDFADKMEDFIDKIKQSKENFYNALLTEFTEIENEIKEEFNDLKEDLNQLKTKWELFIAKSSVDKIGIHLEQAGKTFKKNLKTETDALLQKLHDKINSQLNEEPQKQFRKRKFCKTYDELKVFNSACEIFNKNDIQTGMIYYYYKEKFYCIYQGDDNYLTTCDSLIALMNPQDLAIQNPNPHDSLVRNQNTLMNPQDLAIQNPNPHDSLVRNQNTLARNHRENNIPLFKKAWIVVSILVVAGLIAAAAVFFSPFIALALIPVLGISSLGLYKVCKKTEVVSVDNSLSKQPKIHPRHVYKENSVASTSHDSVVNQNLNNDMTNTLTSSLRLEKNTR